MKIEKNISSSGPQGARPRPPVILQKRPRQRFNGARSQILFREIRSPKNKRQPLFALRPVWSFARPVLDAVRGLESLFQGGLRAS